LIIKATNKNWIGITVIIIFIELGAYLGYTPHAQAALLAVIAFPIYHLIFGLGYLTKEFRITDGNVEVDYINKSKKINICELIEVRVTRDAIIFRSEEDSFVLPKSCFDKGSQKVIMSEFEALVVIKNTNKYI